MNLKREKTKFSKTKKPKQQGITLIALVITIIVLLILAGVSIAMLTGQNGILTQANKAKIEQSHGEVKDGMSLAYNEYQINKNTSGGATNFLTFLEGKTFIENDGKVIVENLTGNKQALGNGTGTNDVYKIEGQEDNYVVNYYDKNETPQEIWTISGSTETGDGGEVTLDPDTGKEELILEYQVSAGDTIELPYDLKWAEYPDGIDGEEIMHDATFNFEVDWGDGTKENGITNANIAEESKHQYQNEGTYEIKIKGIYEALCKDHENTEGDYVDSQGIEKLTKVKQWGTTGLRNIFLYNLLNLTEIVTPTEGSFKELTLVDFSGTGLQRIPDKLFANCEKLIDLSITFEGCTNLVTIGDYAFAECSNVISFIGCFNDCTNLTSIGDYAFANCSGITNFESGFEGYTNLTTIGNYVFANCSSVESFENCFAGCTNLTTIGEHIFDGCENVTNYRYTFSRCTNLRGKAPELWLTGTNSEENRYKGTPDGLNCFFGCYNLDNYEDIPQYWKNEEQ